MIRIKQVKLPNDKMATWIKIFTINSYPQSHIPQIIKCKLVIQPETLHKNTPGIQPETLK